MLGKCIRSPDRVLLPIGCEVQETPGDDSRCQEVEIRRCDNAALVMPRLGPGIGEEDPHTGQGTFRKRLEQLEGVALDDADVVHVVRLEFCKEASDARRVHVDCEDAGFGVRDSLGNGRVAHAESDFEDHRSVIEYLGKRGEGTEFQKMCRPFQRLALLRRISATARLEGLDPLVHGHILSPAGSVAASVI